MSQRRRSRRQPIELMTPDELTKWLEEMREWLLTKMIRERSYLARRAGRGTRTPTDEAYERDQEFEEDLAAMFVEMMAFVTVFQRSLEGG